MNNAIKKGDKVFSNNGDKIVEDTVVAAGPKYLTIGGNVRIVRDTMLRDSNFGAQKKYYSSREELVEVNAKELAWGELNKLVRDRHVAPKELSSAQIVAALNALKGVA